MKVKDTFSRAGVEADTFHFTITHSVWVGNCSLCYCDSEFRAKLIARAINHWRKTEDHKRWYRQMKKRTQVVKKTK